MQLCVEHRHDELVREKLSINASIKAKMCHQEKLAELVANLSEEAPKEAVNLLKKQMDQCRKEIADLQIERDKMAEKSSIRTKFRKFYANLRTWKLTTRIASLAYIKHQFLTSFPTKKMTKSSLVRPTRLELAQLKVATTTSR